MRYFIIISLFFLFCFPIKAQDSIQHKQIKRIINWTGKGILYTGFTYMETQQFYTNYPYSKFHWKNDLHTWKGMDKCFHSFGSYQLQAFFFETHQLFGYTKNQSLNLALLESMVFGFTKEFGDGHIDIGGWSMYDIGMNTIGNLGFYLQQRIWDKQIIKYKYSYVNSGLQHYNPKILGTSYKNYWLRDYNGQTYWLSTSLGALNLTEKKWLKPIGIAFGYGGENLLHEFNNNKVSGAPILIPYRQYYLSLDIDWSEIETNRKSLKTFFWILNRFKFPLPTLQITSNGKLSFSPLTTH